MAFTLPRPSSVALREYVPGNLIYANGNRFVGADVFHRDVDEQRVEMPLFEVSTERQAVKETSATAPPGGPRLRTAASDRCVRRRSQPPVHTSRMTRSCAFKWAWPCTASNATSTTGDGHSAGESKRCTTGAGCGFGS